MWSNVQSRPNFGFRESYVTQVDAKCYDFLQMSNKGILVPIHNILKPKELHIYEHIVLPSFKQLNSDYTE